MLAGSVGCDQATKRVAIAALEGQPTRQFLGDTVRLGLAHNEGAFLSMGANLSEHARFWVLNIAVGLMLLGLLVYTLMTKKLSSLEVAGFAMIVGGGASNWLDRARHAGTVVDFMNVGLGSLRTGIFNVADVAILAGIAVLLWAGRQKRRSALSPTRRLMK